MTTTCPITGLLYCPDIGADARYARRLRKAAMEAKAVYPWLPTNYREREDMKLGGTRLDIMRSHFARSISKVGFALAKHPTFGSYVQTYSHPETRP